MSTFAPWPTTPDWLDKAARDAAHEITRRCVRHAHEERHHSAVCNAAKQLIINHISAAMALARVDIKRPAEPEENFSFWDESNR